MTLHRCAASLNYISILRTGARSMMMFEGVILPTLSATPASPTFSAKHEILAFPELWIRLITDSNFFLAYFM